MVVLLTVHLSIMSLASLRYRVCNSSVDQIPSLDFQLRHEFSLVSCGKAKVTSELRLIDAICLNEFKACNQSLKHRAFLYLAYGHINRHRRLDIFPDTGSAIRVRGPLSITRDRIKGFFWRIRVGHGAHSFLPNLECCRLVWSVSNPY